MLKSEGKLTHSPT